MRFTEENLKKFKMIKDDYFRNIKTKQLYYYYYACKECGYPHLSNSKDGEYCTQRCASTGKNNPMFDKTGKKSPLFGIKRPEHSEKLKGRKRPDVSERMKGENNHFFGVNRTDELSPNWKGGVSAKNIPLYDTFVHQLEPIERCVRDPEDPSILNVFCTFCDKQYKPTRTEVFSRISGINKNDIYRFYCSTDCKQKCPIHQQIKYPKDHKPYNNRSHQHELKVRTFNKDNGVCQICSIEVTLETSICHHEVPVAINGLISLDDDNAWTLCFDCDKHVHSLPGCGFSEIRTKAQKLNFCGEVYISRRAW